MGPHELVTRSAILILAGVWGSLDVWLWLRTRSWSPLERIAVFSGCFALIFVAVMALMYGFLSARLEEQQENVFDHLSAAVSLPPSGDIAKSRFTVVNNGSWAIGRHQLSCRINALVFADDGTEVSGTRDSGPVQEHLPPAGANSTECLSHFETSAIRCADVTLEVEYSLRTQPNETRSKSFRFLATREDRFAWREQPVDLGRSECERKAALTH